MFWLDRFEWYWNILGNIGCFYTVFYIGYYAGRNHLLDPIFKKSKDAKDG